MVRSLRSLIMLAVFAFAVVGQASHVARAESAGTDEDVATEQTDEAKPDISVESMLPDLENLIPRFDGSESGAPPDTGYLPYRWLDENDQFLNEGEPFPPGQDPFRERPGLAPGWFAGVDLFVVHPEIDSQVNNTSLGAGDLFKGTFTNARQLPTGDMNWTVAPKIYAGYRRENGLGEVIASYRFLQANSSGTLLNFDAAGSGQLQTRTQAHVIDLVCAYSDRTDGLAWFLPTLRRYSFGLRAASWVFDATANGRQTLEERAGNVFVGAGPPPSYHSGFLNILPPLAFYSGVPPARGRCGATPIHTALTALS